MRRLKTMMCLGILLTMLMMTAGGCKVEEKDDAKVSDMKFTVISEKELPDELKKIIEIKPTIKDYGVDEKYFLETLDEMSEQAFNDQCTGANPRYPLIAELKEIYLKAYYGK